MLRSVGEPNLLMTMTSAYDIVTELTRGAIPMEMLSMSITQLSRELGWRPTDVFSLKSASNVSNAHVLLEQDLENRMLVSFMRSPRRYGDLQYTEQHQLLSVSYNNLVDWHAVVHADEVTFVFNRTDPALVVERRSISRTAIDSLHRSFLRQLIGRNPATELPAVDELLVNTISYWRKVLSAEVGGASTAEIASLLNAIVCVRACEDIRNGGSTGPSDRLLDRLHQGIRTGKSIGLGSTLVVALNALSHGDLPEYLIDVDRIRQFDSLPYQTVLALVRDFYQAKTSPYAYDFSLISKHALSRIYEHYVSILRVEPTDQQTLFPPVPHEVHDRSHGAIYTPPFLARFFAQYAVAHLPSEWLGNAAVLDPTCGSGVFLRSYLEALDEIGLDGPPADLGKALESCWGVDIDGNACQAARLSLALYHLAKTGEFPRALNIVQADALVQLVDTSAAPQNCAVVFANPPFVRLELQADGVRRAIADVLGAKGSGRLDLYIAVLKLSLDRLREGGLGLFVLPHSFLSSSQASGLRKFVAESFWVHCLADLSGIRVFDNADAYVILLIVQRKSAAITAPVLTTVIRTTESVDQALQAAIDGRESTNAAFGVYSVDPSFVSENDWRISSPADLTIERRVKGSPTVGDIFDVHQGIVTGADSVFIRRAADVPADEKEIYAPLLRDRDMLPYAVPKSTDSYVFYPFIGTERISADQLAKQFPGTWKYLKTHRAALQARKSLDRYGKEWWEPLWPRPPERMLVPKIVTPHVVMLPRFGLDARGAYAVARSPILIPKVGSTDYDSLHAYLAILNSTLFFWLLGRRANVYRGGYLVLEAKSLRSVPLPDMSRVSLVSKSRLIDLAKARVRAKEGEVFELNREVDRIVAEAYGVSVQERQAIGVES